MANLDLSRIAKEIESELPSQEYTLGKGLMQPFNPTNSGSRKIMQGIQREHVMQLIDAEVPIIGTGYENEFGRHSSSYIELPEAHVVIAKVAKFSHMPDHHYFAIIMNKETGMLDVVERVTYKHITESYGYLYNNSYIDNLYQGDIIDKGAVIKKSASFDDYGNKMDGVNLLCAYIASDKTMEDSIIISESAAKRFSAPLVSKVNVVVNDNDILLNLYGDDENYVTFPHIGQKVVNGTLCGIRREKKGEEALFTQSYDRLRDIMMSDEKYTVKGKVVDINIYCNNPEKLGGSYYNNQIKMYYDEHIRFCRDLITEVKPLLDNGLKMSYDLQKLYYTCRDELNGKQYMKDEKVFSNIIMEIVVMEDLPLVVGDKVTDRYGGKGVISMIVPDIFMPKTADGDYIDIQFNQSTCVNRVNPGQLIETEVTFIGSAILDYIASTPQMDADDALRMIYDYISILNKEHADHMFLFLSNFNSETKDKYVANMLANGGILLSLRPMSDSLTIDQLSDLYDAFPWVDQIYLDVPLEDSNGNVRYIQSRRPIIAGRKYIYRVKQFAEEKFSVTSLSSTNIRNENSKSKSSKVFKSLYTRTPVRFGEMETGDLVHLGMEPVVTLLMTYSASPQARRLAEQLLVGDPFNINVKLDEDSSNRGVEINDTYLKTMGLILLFQKRYKEYLYGVLKNPIIKTRPESVLLQPIRKIAEGEVYDPDRYDAMIRRMGYDFNMRWPILRNPIIKLRGNTNDSVGGNPN